MFKITGLDEFKRKLDHLSRNAKRLDGAHQVPMSELFPQAFMRKYSRFSSFQAMYDESPFKEMEFANVPDAEWDSYIKQSTKFTSWEKMKTTGAEEWAGKKLMSGVN